MSQFTHRFVPFFSYVHPHLCPIELGSPKELKFQSHLTSANKTHRRKYPFGKAFGAISSFQNLNPVRPANALDRKSCLINLKLFYYENI